MTVLLSLSFLISDQAIGKDRVFTRDHKYQASEDDSKNSAREKALTQLRIKLLSEVGVYTESYLKLGTITKDGREYIREEIKNITAGITETKILDEKWDGTTYYVKASMKLDPEEVLRLVEDALDSRKSSAEIDRLIQVLSERSEELAKRSEELAVNKSAVNSLSAKVSVQEASLQGMVRGIPATRFMQWMLESEDMHGGVAYIMGVRDAMYPSPRHHEQVKCTEREIEPIIIAIMASVEGLYETDNLTHGAVFAEDGVGMVRAYAVVETQLVNYCGAPRR
jgi:hypothetical protein